MQKKINGDGQTKNPSERREKSITKNAKDPLSSFYIN